MTRLVVITIISIMMIISSMIAIIIIISSSSSSSNRIITIVIILCHERLAEYGRKPHRVVHGSNKAYHRPQCTGVCVKHKGTAVV